MRTARHLLLLPVRLWQWSRPSCSFCRFLDENDVEHVGGLRQRVRLAFAMWRACL